MKKTAGILLCAGFGSRLAPLTEVVPKPAIPFCGAPIAHYALAALERAGVDAIGMNVCHLPDRMVAAMHGGTWLNGTRPIIVSRETEHILGTGGGSAKLAALLGEAEQFIIYHGDVLCNVDLSDALENHERSAADVTLVVLPRPEEVQENVRKSLGMIGVVDHEIVCIRDWWKLGRPQESYAQRCFAGIHIVNRRVLDAIANRGEICLVTQVYRDMLGLGQRINAYEPSQRVFFADVGTPATYLDAQKRCLHEMPFGTIASGVEFDLSRNVCIHDGANLIGSTAENEMVCGSGGIRLGGAWVNAGERS